jgi:hypothetical protein
MSDQLKMHSPNLVDSNIEKIAALFPNCVTEAQGENGELKKQLILTCLNKSFHKFWLRVSKNVIVWIGWEKRIYSDCQCTDC